MKRVCVFCGSSPGVSPAYAASARRVGELLARRGWGLVYGGASVGLMGAVAEAVLGAGGEAVGVIPEGLQARELAHAGLTRLEVVASMHERKARMAELADGFLALPGGLGTLEELSEMLTWAQLGIHRKPCAVLDVDGFWQPLVGFLEHAQREGFVRPEQRALLLVGEDPAALLEAMAAWTPPARPRWLERGES